jgi:lauroyl/myristoyl acyltransferase
LRRRLATNLRMAGLDPTTSRLDHYFANFGEWAGWSLAVYQAGFERSGVADLIDLDQSVSHLDQAVAAGRGVVLAAPHVFCHEMAAAAINRRHRVVALVREAKSPARERLKQRWYEATGLATVRRPRHASVIGDTLAYIRLLRRGQVLAITPDLVVPANRGVPVAMFGREVHLLPGVVVLAMRAGAPVVTAFADRSGPRFRVTFSEPAHFVPSRDHDRGMRRGMQTWCDALETYLKQSPENWMFWLDKRWTMALRTPTRARKAS